MIYNEIFFAVLHLTWLRIDNDLTSLVSNIPIGFLSTRLKTQTLASFQYKDYGLQKKYFYLIFVCVYTDGFAFAKYMPSTEFGIVARLFC